MRVVLRDKTNKQTDVESKAKSKTVPQVMDEKEAVLRYLKGVMELTADINLKYDLSKCIEILEGKENREASDLKSALEEVVQEREQLFREKCELVVEIDCLRSAQQDYQAAFSSDLVPREE